MSETTKAEQIAVAEVKDALRSQLDVYVDDPEFVEMVELSTYAPRRTATSQLSCYLAQASLTPKKRSLRLSAFTEIDKIPASYPMIKIAALKASYIKMVPHGGGVTPISQTPDTHLNQHVHREYTALRALMIQRRAGVPVPRWASARRSHLLELHDREAFATDMKVIMEAARTA
jgi:hypothetical protein